jgi:hypothetical protein
MTDSWHVIKIKIVTPEFTFMIVILDLTTRPYLLYTTKRLKLAKI